MQLHWLSSPHNTKRYTKLSVAFHIIVRAHFQYEVSNFRLIFIRAFFSVSSSHLTSLTVSVIIIDLDPPVNNLEADIWPDWTEETSKIQKYRDNAK